MKVRSNKTEIKRYFFSRKILKNIPNHCCCLINLTLPNGSRLSPIELILGYRNRNLLGFFSLIKKVMDYVLENFVAISLVLSLTWQSFVLCFEFDDQSVQYKVGTIGRARAWAKFGLGHRHGPCLGPAGRAEQRHDRIGIVSHWKYILQNFYLIVHFLGILYEIMLQNKSDLNFYFHWNNFTVSQFLPRKLIVLKMP